MRPALMALIACALLPWCAVMAQKLPPGLGKAGTVPPAPTTGTYAYLEHFDGTDPNVVFDGALTLGVDPPWTGTLTGRDYRLTNTSAPAHVRYSYLLALPDRSHGPLSQGIVHVDVAVDTVYDATYGVGAGMLFDFQPDSGEYIAFVLTDAGYAVYVRGPDGLEQVMSGRSDAFRPGTRNRLTMRASGAELHLALNDDSVGSISFGRAPDGGIGIIALGAGAFTFARFAYETP